MVSDPVADFLSRIRNAIMARHAEVVAPASKLKHRLAELLKDEGYIAGYDLRDDEGADARDQLVTDLLTVDQPRRRAVSMSLQSSHPNNADVLAANDSGGVITVVRPSSSRK